MKIYKPFLIIQLRPETEVSDNEFEAFLEFGKLSDTEVDRIRAEENGLPEVDLSKYSGIIVGGSPFDISTPSENKTYIQNKIEADFKILLNKVVEEDFPFIGVCSGIGLLGNHCGANISKKYGESIGGVDIVLTEEGRSDSLLNNIPKTFRAIVGHKEACDDLPPNAELLASSSTCKVQMFRVGQNVYATQFHPELNVNDLILRINAYKNSGYFNPKDLEELINKVKDEKISEPSRILQNFVEKFRSEK